ncbi:T9SS type A sorting domain-containing protein [Ohtaekwangia koreensis]|uniref:Por secretion system C-terminal sorting domain-containing protein n=1 Tax=Ohtaekwangia koreensis TaxID=688867 RepID=A0A1T5L840_9BACT|nr:T9SS type A sorting domain-containing protein [Ohtaekwangia koreensis]SKC72113.1 Por secretion system C-terminal sorting domain-containing protein [Ohtaekwangia koreensis]
MKTLIKVLVAGCLFITSSAIADDIIPAPVYKQRELFVIKAQKKFKGAKVEVFQANGELMTSQNLQKRKMIIDFGSVQQGTYVIRLTKGDDVQEFQYISKQK